MSKAFSRSKNIAAVNFLSSLNPLIICCVSRRIWTWQLLFRLKPYCSGGNMLFVSAQLVILLLIIFSSSFARQFNSEIGRYEVKSFFGFPRLWIIMILAAFHDLGM